MNKSDWQIPGYTIEFEGNVDQQWCVVIPVINEGERILSQLGKMKSLAIPSIADIIIVDGGSTDGSLEIGFLKSVGVKSLIVKTGEGALSAQLRCAYGYALSRGYQGIITIDGNDKDDSDPIPAFIEELKSGVDFVQASRYLSGGVSENAPVVRDLAIRLIHAPLLSLFSGFHWTDTTQGFRGYSRRMLEDPQVAPFRDLFLGYELLAYLSYRAPKLGYRCKEVATTRRYPATGKTPTKITGLGGNLKLLTVLIRACLGCYNPERK